MKNLKIKLGIGVLVIIIIGGIFIIFSSPKDKTNTQSTNSAPKETLNPNTTEPSTSNTKTYTLDEVKIHNSKQSCWTVVNGSVYDVTSWIGQHPGGASAILYMCGKDASSAFDNQHGGQKRPESELKSFLIGKLN